MSTPVGRSETTQQMSDHDVHPCVPRADTNGRHDGRHDGPTRGPVISRPSLSVGSRDKWANFDGRHLSASVVLCAAISTSMSEMHLSRQWRRKGEGGEASPYGWKSKNYVICVYFHCHGTSLYHTTNTLQGRRAKSHVDTQTIQPGLGDFVL